MTEVLFYAFISSGKKNAFYTLWTGRHGVGNGGFQPKAHYVCNLSTNEEDAERKALDYIERLSDRIGQKVTFDGFDTGGLARRRGRLSVSQSSFIDTIEAGRFPFGKHKGEEIASAPDSYILFFADKHSDRDVVTQALAASCLGVAMERDLIAKREVQRAEWAAQCAKSEHIGAEGQRLDLEGEVVLVINRPPTDYDMGCQLTKIRCGDNLVTCFSILGEKGACVKFRATVKRHEVRDGVKQTLVQRPKLAKAA